MLKRIALAIACLGIAASPSFGQTVQFPAATAPVLSVTSAQIIGTNPNRQGLTICNPSAIIVWIAPQPIVAAANGGGSIGLAAAATGVVACFSTPAGFRAGNGWNGISASATPAITVLEY